jgi:cytochrome c-type biogenesis protein
VFALVPAYIGYLGGRSAASAVSGRSDRLNTFTHGLAFVLGFTTIFAAAGFATSVIGGLLTSAESWLMRIGGIVVVLFGLHMVGILRIPFLEYDLRPQSTPDRNRGYIASYLMGIFFSAGWSPCVGPILGTILTLALYGGSPTAGTVYLLAYSAGLAIPFLIASVQIGLVTTVLKRYRNVSRIVEIGFGIVMILIGILLFLGRFETMASFGSFIGAIDERLVGIYLLLGLAGLVILGLIPAVLAKYLKGRSFLEWWLFGAVLFPVAIVMVFFLKPLPVHSQAVDPTLGSQSSSL